MEEVNIESHNMGPTFCRLKSLSFLCAWFHFFLIVLWLWSEWIHVHDRFNIRYQGSMLIILQLFYIISGISFGLDCIC